MNDTILNESSLKNQLDDNDPDFPAWNKRRFEDWEKWCIEKRLNEKKQDYQMSLIELDHQFSLDLLKF